jgi:CRISPR/Cas system-associated exonuclease Cas4 (RecB family)
MLTNNPVRKRPYVWVSWITKLLSGEDRCWWKAWYKARHKYAKVPDDPGREEFFAEWTATHDAIVEKRAARLRDAGWVVRCEEDAEFKLAGAGADLAGKPDLVAVRDGMALVIDAKSGKRRRSDHWQVLVYLFGLGLSWCKGLSLEGEVAYRDGEEPVEELTHQKKQAIAEAVRAVSSDSEPARAPSARECRYCDVAACPDRVTQQDSRGDARAYF